jgi:hypothetical protein
MTKQENSEIRSCLSSALTSYGTAIKNDYVTLLSLG